MNDLIEVYAYLVKQLSGSVKAKDSMFSIIGEYQRDFGVVYVIQHEGQLHDIAHELGVSQNNFSTYDEAEQKLIGYLIKWIEQDITNLGAIKEVLTEEDKEVINDFYQKKEKLQ